MSRILTGLLLCGTIGIFDALPVAAQRRAGIGLPRVFVSGWAGRFIDVGGFSDDENTFFRWDDAMAYGGALHIRPGQTALFGLDVVYSRPSYERIDRDSSYAGPISTGDANVLAAMASARLSGTGGMAGIYLTGAAGAFIWDGEELGGRDADPALMIGVGFDYLLRGSAVLFGEYGQWWVYHQKDDTVAKNTANHQLIRVGLRYGF